MAGVIFQSTTPATPPAGTKVAVDIIAGEDFQLMKLTLGDAGVDDGPISSANPMPVSDVSTSNDMEGGGVVVVGTTAVAVTFTGVTKAIIISADIANTGTLYVGKSNVTSAGANAFACLEAGESLTIEYDDATNAVYVVASIAAQNFWKGALL